MLLGLKRGTVIVEPHNSEWEISATKMINTIKSILKKDAADIETKKKNVAEELGKVEEAAKQKLAEIIKNNSEELAKKKADIEAKKNGTCCCGCSGCSSGCKENK